MHITRSILDFVNIQNTKCNNAIMNMLYWIYKYAICENANTCEMCDMHICNTGIYDIQTCYAHLRLFDFANNLNTRKYSIVILRICDMQYAVSGYAIYEYLICDMQLWNMK